MAEPWGRGGERERQRDKDPYQLETVCMRNAQIEQEQNPLLIKKSRSVSGNVPVVGVQLERGKGGGGDHEVKRTSLNTCTQTPLLTGLAKSIGSA